MFIFLNSYLSPLFKRAFVVFCLFLFSNSVFSQSTDLSLQGIIDFTVPGGGNAGKAIHVKAINSIPDLSIYGIGVANNGGGTDGQEYIFDAISVSAGDNILIARDVAVMTNYFDVCAGSFEYILDATSGNGGLSSTAISQNGDDAIELFMNGVVVETFGDINVDGTNTAWEYMDSWAYKINSGTAGSFVLADWSFGGINCTDGTTTIYDATCLYPICPSLTYVPDDNFENYLEANGMGDGIALNDSVLTSNINSVTNLTVSSLSITDFTGLEDFSSLTNLDAQGNSSLSSVDLSQNIALADARFNSCNLNSLDVSSNPLLSILTCGGNNLSALDVSQNSLLTTLDCWSNSISVLDLSQNTALTNINCNSNQISNLDFSNCLNMTSVSCNSNQLTSLDVTNLTALQILWCPGNQITNLDLSQNTVLNTIRCENNQLTRLDVKNGNNTNVSQFFSNGNSVLTCINVDDSTYSTNNWTNIDSQQYFGELCYCNLIINNQTNVSCYGGYNGSLTLSATGGVGFYSYSLGLYNVFFDSIFSIANTGIGWYATPINLYGISPNCYIATVVDSLGCGDSLTICITEPDSIYSINNRTVCNSTVWNGVNFNSSGTYSSIVNSSNGCDSNAILNLVVNTSDTTFSSITSCDSFIWDGITYSLTGIYTNVCTDINGCDSVAILNLTINYSDTTNFSIVICDSYIWNGVNYINSGVYINNFSNLKLITLNQP